MENRSRILIVDDDESACRSLTLVLRKKGYETKTAGTGREAIEKVYGRFFNMVLLDIRLPDIEGIELLWLLKEMDPDMVVIMATAYASVETAVRALNEGASAYITKPLNMDAVLATVRDAVERQRLVMENRRLYHEAQRELAERKRAEEQLSAAKRQYEELYEHARECYVIIDDDTGRLVQPNRQMLRVLGYSKQELEGFHFLDVVDEADRQPVADYHRATLEKNRGSEDASTSCDCWVRTKAGERRHLKVTELRLSSIPGTVLSAVDFTEQEKMKKIVMQSEKLSSLGQLAAGLAHELRNPLAVISSCAQFCLENIVLTRPVSENLQMVYRNSQRANKLINDLLEFARPSHLERRPVDVNEVVTSMLHMAKLDSPPFQVSIVEELDKGLPEIMGDAEKLGQVFLNLFLNASQAASNRGKVVVQTHSLAPQKLVELNVIDDGPGIPEEYRHRVFDPFFTTKDGGTGLGLSICHSIVQQHQGSVTVDSASGHGTRVSVRLPVTQNGREQENGY